MRAKLRSWWAHEPARVVSQTGAAIALAGALGFGVSDQGAQSLMAVATALAALCGGEVIRSQVSPVSSDGAAPTGKHAAL